MTTQSRTMSVNFRTDSSYAKEGFMATYTFIDASTTCGGYYFATTGVITSPNYPNYYPERKSCEWVINAADRYQVSISFKKFNIESHRDCAYDYLEIR